MTDENIDENPKKDVAAAVVAVMKYVRKSANLQDESEALQRLFHYKPLDPAWWRTSGGGWS